MKKPLSQMFTALSYQINIKPEQNIVQIEGVKLKPPSRRLTFYQKNLKILSAKITYQHKKGDQEMEIERINHIKSFEQVRLHSSQIMYPGTYHLELVYRTSKPLNELLQGRTWPDGIWRDIVPCIDEDDSRKNTKLEIDIN